MHTGIVLRTVKGDDPSWHTVEMAWHCVPASRNTLCSDICAELTGKRQLYMPCTHVRLFCSQRAYSHRRHKAAGMQAHSMAPLIERTDEWMRNRAASWQALRHRTEVTLQAVLANRGLDLELDPSGCLERAVVARGLVQGHVRLFRICFVACQRLERSGAQDACHACTLLALCGHWYEAMLCLRCEPHRWRGCAARYL